MILFLLFILYILTATIIIIAHKKGETVFKAAIFVVWAGQKRAVKKVLDDDMMTR